MEKLKELFETTELTNDQIGEIVGLSRRQIGKVLSKLYTKEQRSLRKRACYRNSKLGDKNPMSGKTGEKHHMYIGEVGDGYGYTQQLKPEWYTGRKGSKHVFTHHIVVCEALGLTCIPKGYVVHHIDHNRSNNNLNNLALMSMAAHTRLHQLESKPKK